MDFFVCYPGDMILDGYYELHPQSHKTLVEVGSLEDTHIGLGVNRESKDSTEVTLETHDGRVTTIEEK